MPAGNIFPHTTPAAPQPPSPQSRPVPYARVRTTLGTPETNVDTPTPSPVKKGHPKGFWFFFWGEFAERCSFYGMRAILADYMAQQLGFGEANSGTYMSFFIAACYLLPLAGGYIADNFFGKYWTIVGFSLPYIVGQFIVGIENPYVLFIALCLLAMGSGVIKPNISTLMGMTYEQQRPGQDQLRSSAFSWFYFAINVGALLSQTALPMIRDRYGYQAAFLFPAFFMILALGMFALGKPYYAKEVIVRRKSTPEERKAKLQILGRIIGLFVVVMFFWGVFDQTASVWVFFCNTYMDKNLLGFKISGAQTQAINPFFIITLLPLSTTAFLYLDRKGYKISATQKMFAGFLLTVAGMAVMAVAGSVAGTKESRMKLTAAEGTVTYSGGKVEYETKADGKDGGKNGVLKFESATVETPDGRVVLGPGEASLGNAEAAAPDTLKFKKGSFEFFDGRLTTENGSATFKDGKVSDKTGEIPHEGKKLAVKKKSTELEEYDWVKPEGRISIWWIVLAYLFLTLAEIVISPVGLQLAFEAAPRSMNSFVTGCWLASVFLANFAINSWLTRFYPEMTPTSYFLMLTVMMAVVSVAFLVIANRFQAKMKAAAERTNPV
jgi:dipeptide/tripeptide permease